MSPKSFLGAFSESVQGGLRSCISFFRRICECSDPISVLGTGGVETCMICPNVLSGQFRAIWLLSPHSKSCLPTGHSDAIWLVLPQYKQYVCDLGTFMIMFATIFFAPSRLNMRLGKMPQFNFHFFVDMAHLECRRWLWRHVIHGVWHSIMAFCCHQWPLLLTWFNFNPSMDKLLHPL